MKVRLFNIVDYVPVINKEELVLHEPFKTLLSLEYNKQPGDTQGRNRTRAFKELVYMYFAYDPSSDYINFSEEEKKAEAVKAANLQEDFEESEVLQQCIEIYTAVSKTRALKLLESTNKAIDALRGHYEALTPESIEDPSKLIASLRNLSGVVDSLHSLEDKVKKELKQSTDIRGDNEPGFIQ